LGELQDLFMSGASTDVKLLDVRIVSADERTARKLELTKGDRPSISGACLPEKRSPFSIIAHI